MPGVLAAVPAAVGSQCLMRRSPSLRSKCKNKVLYYVWCTAWLGAALAARVSVLACIPGTKPPAPHPPVHPVRTRDTRNFGSGKTSSKVRHDWSPHIVRQEGCFPIHVARGAHHKGEGLWVMPVAPPVLPQSDSLEVAQKQVEEMERLLQSKQREVRCPRLLCTGHDRSLAGSLLTPCPHCVPLQAMRLQLEAKRISLAAQLSRAEADIAQARAVVQHVPAPSPACQTGKLPWITAALLLLHQSTQLLRPPF